MDIPNTIDVPLDHFLVKFSQDFYAIIDHVVSETGHGR